LFAQGDPSDALYITVSGLLVAKLHKSSGVASCGHGPPWTCAAVGHKPPPALRKRLGPCRSSCLGDNGDRRY
jgi:hypothetical protein